MLLGQGDSSWAWVRGNLEETGLKSLWMHRTWKGRTVHSLRKQRMFTCTDRLNGSEPVGPTFEDARQRAGLWFSYNISRCGCR